MTNQLPEALRALAEKAGYEVSELGLFNPCYWPGEYEGEDAVLVPGADGTLSDAECTVVLGWLMKIPMLQVEIWNDITSDPGPPQVIISGAVKTAIGNGDTLPAALAAAVVALKLEVRS